MVMDRGMENQPPLVIWPQKDESITNTTQVATKFQPPLISYQSTFGF